MVSLFNLIYKKTEFSHSISFLVYLSHPKPSWYTSRSPKTFLVYLAHPKHSWYTSLTQNLLGIPLSPKTFLVYLAHPKPSWYTSLTQNLLGIPLSPKTFLVYLAHPKPSWYTNDSHPKPSWYHCSTVFSPLQGAFSCHFPSFELFGPEFLCV